VSASAETDGDARDCCGSAGLERGALRLGDADRHRRHLLDLALDQELLDAVFMADSHQRTLHQPLGDGALGCDRGAEQGGGRKGGHAGGEGACSHHFAARPKVSTEMEGL